MLSRIYHNYNDLETAIMAAKVLHLDYQLHLISDVEVDGDILFAAGHPCRVTRVNWAGMDVEADGRIVNVGWDQEPQVRLEAKL